MDGFLQGYSLEELREKLESAPYRPFLKHDNEYFHEYKGLELINDEIFCEYSKYPLVKVSNLGRVLYNGEILTQKPKSENDYDYLCVNIPNFDSSKLVYQLVAETFMLQENPDPLKYNIIHHLTNNGFDNRVINLLYVTNEQHGLIHGWGKINKCKNRFA